MTAQDYARMTRPFRRHPALAKVLRLCNRLLTRIIYVCYPVLLAVLVLGQDHRFWRVLMVPAVSFVLVSVFRWRFNAPRPYEVLDIQPLIVKDTHGHSFPSRHVFSVFIIACAFWWVLPALGAVVCVCGVLLAVIRVLGGVHFPRDVIAGALLGLLAGVIGFVLIP